METRTRSRGSSCTSRARQRFETAAFPRAARTRSRRWTTRPPRTSARRLCFRLKLRGRCNSACRRSSSFAARRRLTDTPVQSRQSSTGRRTSPRRPDPRPSPARCFPPRPAQRG
eukprot:30078-Pelagococcus_subviridis.AAC.1